MEILTEESELKILVSLALFFKINIPLIKL